MAREWQHHRGEPVRLLGSGRARVCICVPSALVNSWLRLNIPPSFCRAIASHHSIGLALLVVVVAAGELVCGAGFRVAVASDSPLARLRIASGGATNHVDD